MVCRLIDSPAGPLLLAAEQGALCAIRFGGQGWREDPDEAASAGPDAAVLDGAERQLEEYFAGRRTTFDLPLRPAGTPFQQRVWAVLRTIPYGRTMSYGEVAARIGNPRASRAVGMANHANPLPIVIPCHRVIGASGRLTGYAGGLAVKRLLLGLEQGRI